MGKERVIWLDMLKGFAMFLVVYSHNFPAINDYIYSFHVPLFFFISGIFHKKNTQTLILSIKERFKTIMIPYYLWGTLLFIFWIIIGRHFGNSKTLSLSIFDNFQGLLFAQGGTLFMDWGIPLWFLPCLFMVFIVFSIINLIKIKELQYLSICMLSIIGYYSNYFFEWYIYSLDIALVALLFYAVGYYCKNIIFNSKMPIYLVLIFALILLVSIQFNSKVDMYRSDYGNNIFLFYLNALLAISILVYVFKFLPKFNFLIFIGKNTILYLALQIRALTIIKALLFFGFGYAAFEFSEFQKLGITLLQIVLIIPVVYFINRYLPILNGNKK